MSGTASSLPAEEKIVEKTPLVLTRSSKQHKQLPPRPNLQPRRRPPRLVGAVVQGRDDLRVGLQRLGTLELEGRREQTVLRAEGVGL